MSMDVLGLLMMCLVTGLGTAHPSKPLSRSARRVCLPGPKANQEKDTHQPKCLILGDSISIGYTGYVQKALRGKCAVYHAPWDVGDGGALDTKHGLDCLQLLMSSYTLHPLTYDAIVFNFGLHDVDCDRIQEEFTSLKNYTKNLKSLKKSFLTSGAKVAYALTTPILDDCQDNELVVKYNKAANDVMRDDPRLEVIDLYDVIIKKCGGPPRKSQAPDCPITSDSLIPHYTSHGYRLLADPVIKILKKLLKAKKKVSRDDRSGDDSLSNKPDISEVSKKVKCKSRDNIVVSACPANSTCVANKMSGSGFACCLLPAAVDCKDGTHCCPNGSKCSPYCTKRKCSCLPLVKSGAKEMTLRERERKKESERKRERNRKGKERRKKEREKGRKKERKNEKKRDKEKETKKRRRNEKKERMRKKETKEKKRKKEGEMKRKEERRKKERPRFNASTVLASEMRK